jgi:membrane protein required for colicin V production
MVTCDIIFLLILGIGLLLGLTKGFIKQLSSLLGLIIGLFVAKTLFIMVAERIAPYLKSSMTTVQWISFLATWLIVPIGFSILGSILTKLMKAIYLDGFNRILGGILGIIKFGVILGLLINMLEFVDKEHQIIPIQDQKESFLYVPLRDAVEVIVPVIATETSEINQKIKTYGK